MSEAVDVCIVGSGAGGGTLAYWLAKAGARVVVLEKGPHLTLADFARHDEIAVTRGGLFVPPPTLEPHLVQDAPGEKWRVTDDGWIANCVGGGTVHMSGYFLRLHPDDLRQRSVYGRPEGSSVEDWPISYEELEPWYELAERLIGVSGDGARNPFEPPRSAPYPMPPLPDHPLALHLDAAAARLGWHPYNTPRAVLSQLYDGRPPCNFCGHCGSFGCWNGSKSSVLATFIPKALATGRCTIVPRAMATEVVAGSDGKVRGVRWLDERGELHEQRARVVVVSCSTIESSRLLLNSRSKRFPDGLANGNGQVGRNLCFSANASVLAELHEDGGGKGIPGLLEGRTMWLGRSVQDFYRLEGGPVPKAGTLRFDLVPPNPIANAQMASMSADLPLWGRALKAEMDRRFHHSRTLAAEIFAEFVPVPESRVETDSDVRDRHGLPVAKIAVRHHANNGLATGFLADRAEDLFREMGCDRVWTRSRLGITWVLQHGALRFGSDPARSVLDRNCRSHEVPNLYVVDGGFMPTSGSVPSTLTIQANALRVAEHLADAFRRREL
ncbi:GMC family oxidoreductase [Vulgatibacter incomptus]|uniref:Glucose-methanol-choline (GMC) oxidoreductase:NAD binding site n=1 Tax=Vulgatibacter incomptus TaxID=1391653 RepID=A0A0K1PF34_9BACT|nr:GMC family oxidoreductase [Vulgatibacter incomptus]AKU92122.1 Glucose-methanol-choline (GMC) oxidoreductase:NAD binding site [Vulgatibacter incomptus]